MLFESNLGFETFCLCAGVPCPLQVVFGTVLLVGSKDLFRVNDAVIAETACCRKVLKPVTVYKVLERQGCIFNKMLRI